MMMISSKREQVPAIYWIDSAKANVMRFLLADCSQLIATDKVIHDDDDDGD